MMDLPSLVTMLGRLTSLRCLAMLLILAAVPAVRVRCQTEPSGFISIACGMPQNTTYLEGTTKIWYVSDFGFTDTGVNRNMSAAYVFGQGFGKSVVRSFPDGDRNCYTIRSLTSGAKYLVRALFIYGNYDGLSKPPIFDVYLGVDLWGTVDLVANDMVMLEIIVVSPNDYLQVCLVNKKLGTPVIYNLVLRPLTTPRLYPDANATQSLVLVKRHNMGPTNPETIIRYPDDPYDRAWLPYNDASTDTTKMSTTLPVKELINDLFEPPSVVMQTAITPVNSSTIDYSWQLQPGSINNFVVALFFSEMKPLPANMLREFTLIFNGDRLFLNEPFSPNPKEPESDVVYGIARGYEEYKITLNATQRSTLPPILNAVEVYSVLPAAQNATNNTDVSAIMAIKEQYQVKRNWVGDPCVPEAFTWDGLNCSYAAENPSRITSLKLSKSGLNGVIIASFAEMTALEYLDLSQNDLSGPVPDFLEKLSSLTYLDLSGNKLDGSVPDGLLKRSQEGSLTLRIGDTCENSTTCELRKKSNRTAIIASVTVVVLVILVVTLVVFMCSGRRKKVTSVQTKENSRSLQFDNQSFSKGDLKKITKNFHEENKIGEGGFGSVYSGQLDDGTPVAVKMRKESSTQGLKEFIAEAQALIRVHHKSLVAMIGYCKDTESLALVYEFMSGGTLRGRLRGDESKNRPLTWLQRLRIALESAQGLEYLHTSCKPPLIHRDVKTENILLSENLEAKIADFGLSRAFDYDKTHICTQVAGTLGYLDPEYYHTSTLSEKSDVFSFGVVLLELVTGKAPILQAPENSHIRQWVQHRTARGNIESVADANMKGQYDVNSLWKVTELALRCITQSSKQRPSMTDVVVELKDSIALAIGCPERVRPQIGGQLPGLDYFQSDGGYSDHENILGTVPLGMNTADLGPRAR